MNKIKIGFLGAGYIAGVHAAILARDERVQIAVIHEAFAPSKAEIDKALKIVAAYEDAQQHGLGVVSLGSKMIDSPVVQRALKLVARAKQMGKA